MSRLEGIERLAAWIGEEIAQEEVHAAAIVSRSVASASSAAAALTLFLLIVGNLAVVDVALREQPGRTMFYGSVGLTALAILASLAAARPFRLPILTESDWSAVFEKWVEGDFDGSDALLALVYGVKESKFSALARRNDHAAAALAVSQGALGLALILEIGILVLALP